MDSVVDRMESGTLQGRGVLITRPQPLAARLATAVRAAGGTPIVFPTIEILPPPDPVAVQSVLARLHEFDFAVFISQNAVLQAERLRRGPWPGGVRAAAVGAGTAAALRDAGIGPVIAPRDGGDSEALAALPEFRDLGGRSVVIFRGAGGRSWLRDTLAARGARVEYAECYVRGIPCQGAGVPTDRDAGVPTDQDAGVPTDQDAGVPQHPGVGTLLAKWRDGDVQAVVITSAEGLANLQVLLGEANHALLRATPVFVPHPRIAQSATAAGVARVIVTGPGDAGIVAGLTAYFRRS